MTLAERWGLTDLPAYVPAAFAVTAFAVGVQGALVLQALAGAGYPPGGRGALAWATVAVVLASAVLHTPPAAVARGAARAWDALADLGARRSVVLEPHPDETVYRPEDANGAGGANGEASLRLSARVHSPLAAGPAVAPGETLPVTVEAEPEELARKLEATFELRGPSRTRTVHRAMEGTRLVEGVEFQGTGRFEVHVELDHPDADPVGETLTGRVTPYREEVGRLFEQLKARLAEAGLDVGPQSTPREACEELGRVDAADPGDLADLAVELEVALYGDGTIERATYETVYTTLQALELPDAEEVPG